MCVLLPFYQWGHFVMLIVRNLYLISVQSRTYLLMQPLLLFELKMTVQKRQVTCSNILLEITYTKYKLPLIQNLKWESIQLLMVTRVGTYWQHTGASKPNTRTPINLKWNHRILILINNTHGRNSGVFSIYESLLRDKIPHCTQLKVAPFSIVWLQLQEFLMNVFFII